MLRSHFCTLALCLASFLPACSQAPTSPSTQGKAYAFEAEKVVLPDTEAVYFNRKDKVFFTSDFSVEDISALKTWGVQYVIYLVDDIEPTPEMFDSVEAAGMTVVPMDFLWEGRKAGQQLQSIEKIFMKHHKENKDIVAVASSDLDIVRAWLAFHLRKAHRMDVEEALTSSEQLDAYSSEEVKAKARKLIQKI